MPLRRPRSPRPLVLRPGDSNPVTHKHAPTQSSYLIFPPSPTSLLAIPRTPLTPPPRLHLRTLQADLPSPPISPQYLASAPDIPYPWIWRCHMCGSNYRLGVTRRCLHDGHFFCSVPPPRADTPVTSEEGHEDNLNSSSQKGIDTPLAKDRAVKRKREKSRRERRRAMGCNAEFDYTGWAQYNVWRRCIKIYKFEKAQSLKRQGKREGGGSEEEEEEFEWKGKKDCWSDCEFPSECNNNLMQEELERRRIQELFVEQGFKSSDTEIESEDGEERWGYKGKVMGIEEWEAELQRQKGAEFEKQEEDLREMERFTVAIHGVDPQSFSSSSIVSSPPSSHMSEEMDIVDMERRGLEGEAQMVELSLGPISPSSSSAYITALEDEDEYFYGTEFANRKRKKSVQKIAQLTGLMLGVEPVERGYEEEKPRSPLKEGFTFGDQSWGGDDGSRAGDKEVEREIEKLERGGNLLRRWVGKDEVGEFGDEDEDEDDIL